MLRVFTSFEQNQFLIVCTTNAFKTSDFHLEIRSICLICVVFSNKKCRVGCGLIYKLSIFTSQGFSVRCESRLQTEIGFGDRIGPKIVASKDALSYIQNLPLNY